MSKVFAVRRLDVKAFAEQGGRLVGADTVAAHERLMAETQGRNLESAVTWSLRGELRHPGHVKPEIWLHLQAQTALSLVCQRCLQPVMVPVSVDRPFRFVVDEATAEAEDDESEEDVLALTSNLDVMELIEDELLMELPVGPRHEVCPEPLPTESETGIDLGPDQERNPFALLQRLKGGKSSERS